VVQVSPCARAAGANQEAGNGFIPTLAMKYDTIKSRILTYDSGSGEATVHDREARVADHN